MILTLRIPDESWLSRSVSDVLSLRVAKTSTAAETAAVLPGPADAVRTAVELARRTGARRGVAASFPQGVFDLEDMTRRALGAHWEARSPAERAELASLFGRHLARAYRAWFAGTVGRVVLSGGTTDGARSTVWSTARLARGTRRIEHRLRQVHGTWLVHDFLVEDESFVEQQSHRLERSIQESSWDEVLWQLKLEDVKAAAGEVRRPGS